MSHDDTLYSEGLHHGCRECDPSDGDEAKTLTAEELRTWRAIDVLERLGNAEARELLKALAAGAPGALATTAAHDALKRQE